MSRGNNVNDTYALIYEMVRLCPAGRVTTYGALAAAVGLKSGARLVGYAMNNCHGISPAVPAHRVVNRNGLLTGKHHFGSSTAMQEFLEAEGISVIDDQIVDFEKHFWNPATELDMD